MKVQCETYTEDSIDLLKNSPNFRGQNSKKLSLNATFRPNTKASVVGAILITEVLETSVKTCCDNIEKHLCTLS